MVRSKKILSASFAVIFICAMIAPSAISAAAESYNNASQVMQYELGGWSCDPDYFYYDQRTDLGSSNGRTYFKTNNGGAIAFWYVGDNSSGPVLISPDRNSVLTWGSGFTNPTIDTINVNGLVFYYNGFYHWIDEHYSYTTSLPVIESSVHMSKQQLVAYALNLVDFSVTEPVPPEPEPIPDANDYIIPEMGMGYTNYTTNFPTFSQLNTPCNVDANNGKFTWVSVSGSGIKSVLLGRLGEYSFSNNMVIRGSAGITINMSLDQFQVQASGLTAEFRFANGAEPSFSTYFSTSVPQGWESNFYLSSMSMGSFGTMINFTFYIVMSSDIVTDLGFTPLYPQVVFHNLPNTFDYAPYGFTFQYYQLSTPSSPLPPDYTHTWYDIPNTDSYYVTQNPTTYNPNAASELAYYVSLYTDQDDKIQEVIELAIANLFHHNDPNGMVSLFSTLADSFTTTNTDFHIYLPAVSIPWANSTLNLWPKIEIPFKTYIDAIPTVILVVVSFLFLLSGVLVYFRFYYKFLKDLTRGNYQF